jgi:hypothetical protein
MRGRVNDKISSGLASRVKSSRLKSAARSVNSAAYIHLCAQSQMVMAEVRRFLKENAAWTCDSSPAGGVDVDPWITLDFTLKPNSLARRKAFRVIGDFIVRVESKLENMRVFRIPGDAPTTIRYQFRIVDRSHFLQTVGRDERGK